MKAYLLIHRIGQQLTNWSESKMGAKRDGRMFCSDCGRSIHRGDRFTVQMARHVRCLDPKLVGQTVMPAGFPEPLGKMLAKEVGECGK